MRLIILCGAVILAACAKPVQSAGGRDAACPLRASDSTFMARGPVYRDCAVDEKARITIQGSRPDFQPTQVRSGCFSAHIDFVVDVSGTPEVETARIVRATDQQFARAVLVSIATQRYKPAMRDGVPVRQIVNYVSAMTSMVVVVPAGGAPPASRAPRRPPC